MPQMPHGSYGPGFVGARRREKSTHMFRAIRFKRGRGCAWGLVLGCGLSAVLARTHCLLGRNPPCCAVSSVGGVELWVWNLVWRCAWVCARRLVWSLQVVGGFGLAVELDVVEGVHVTLGN